MPLPEESRNVFIPVLALALEIALGFLFLFKPRSRITWALCFIFHGLIALLGVWDFTATILILAMLARGYHFKLTKSSKTMLFLHLAIWILYSFLKLPLVPFYFAMTFTTMLFFLLSSREEVPGPTPLKTPAYLALLLLFYQASGPLLGHTQHPSLAMFSNLETSASYRNSFMPLLPTAWLDSDIKITKTHAPYYSKNVSRTFKREWSQTKEVYLPIGIFYKIPSEWVFDFEFKGMTYHYPSLEAEKIISENEPNGFEKKLVGLRMNRQGFCGN